MPGNEHQCLQCLKIFCGGETVEGDLQGSSVFGMNPRRINLHLCLNLEVIVCYGVRLMVPLAIAATTGSTVHRALGQLKCTAHKHLRPTYEKMPSILSGCTSAVKSLQLLSTFEVYYFDMFSVNTSCIKMIPCPAKIIVSRPRTV